MRPREWNIDAILGGGDGGRVRLLTMLAFFISHSVPCLFSILMEYYFPIVLK